MTNLLLFVVGLWLAGCGVVGLLRGNVLDGGMGNDKHIQRQSEPINYWITTGVYCAVGGVFLWNAFV